MSWLDDGPSRPLDGTDVDLLLSGAELEARRERIVEFIAGTVDDAGAEGAVLGLSGGTDSTTTAYLAVERVVELYEESEHKRRMLPEPEPEP